MVSNGGLMLDNAPHF